MVRDGIEPSWVVLFPTNSSLLFANTEVANHIWWLGWDSNPHYSPFASGKCLPLTDLNRFAPCSVHLRFQGLRSIFSLLNLYSGSGSSWFNRSYTTLVGLFLTQPNQCGEWAFAPALYLYYITDSLICQGVFYIFLRGNTRLLLRLSLRDTHPAVALPGLSPWHQ